MIYTKSTDTEKIYYVRYDGNEYRLNQYIQYVNTVTVNM